MATKKASVAKPSWAPWTPALRLKLTASRRKDGVEPPGFFLDADQAASLLQHQGPAPATLTVMEEDERAMRFRFSEWKGSTGRAFANESWNALVALWVARAGWQFVFDRLLEPDGQLKEAFRQADPGAPWYAVRRYLRAASEAEFALALSRVRPVFDTFHALTEAEDWDKLRQRDFMAFAFDRAGLVDLVLRDFVGGRCKYLPEPGPLVAGTTDTALATAAADKAGSVGSNIYTIFDLVESQGAASVPLLERHAPFNAGERKVLAKAVEVAEALG